VATKFRDGERDVKLKEANRALKDALRDCRMLLERAETMLKHHQPDNDPQ
jgi:hypothetical protein